MTLGLKSVHKHTWALAVVIILAFTWLGVAADSFGKLYEGLDLSLSPVKIFTIRHGVVIYPGLGLIAAVAMILQDALAIRCPLRRSMLVLLTLLLIFFAAWGFFVIMLSPVTLMGHPLSKRIPTNETARF